MHKGFNRIPNYHIPSEKCYETPIIPSEKCNKMPVIPSKKCSDFLIIPLKKCNFVVVLPSQCHDIAFHELTFLSYE